MSHAEFQAQGGRTKPRQRTPSPERKPLKVHKEVGIGQKRKTSEFGADVAKKLDDNKTAKPKPKAKVKLAIASDDED